MNQCSNPPNQCLYTEIYLCEEDCPHYEPLNASIGEVVGVQCKKCGSLYYKHSNRYDFEYMYFFGACDACGCVTGKVDK
jgi:hypothetical protein